MSERDERPLNEIQFALDVQDPIARAARAEAVRDLLARAGVSIAQDIVDLGCTGLILQLFAPTPVEARRGMPKPLVVATYMRESMSGSICGLPCYVPPTRFCLVHNTIGALQLVGNVDGAQTNPHPEGVALCSRELTDEERKQAGAVGAVIDEHARKAAKDFGLEVIDEPSEDAEALGAPLKNRGLPLLSGFCCPEHAEPVWRCRFCLAAAVIAGDFEPVCVLRVFDERGGDKFRDNEANELAAILDTDAFSEVDLYVRAAVWLRKLVREGG